MRLPIENGNPLSIESEISMSCHLVILGVHQNQKIHLAIPRKFLIVKLLTSFPAPQIVQNVQDAQLQLQGQCLKL
jgi:hypothetical protein